MPGKTYKQIQNKCRLMFIQQRDSKTPIPVDKRIPRGCKQWSDKEQQKLVEGIKLFGRDNVRLAKFVGKREPHEINTRIRWCAYKFKGFPISRDMIISKVWWSKEEEATYIRIIKKHGLNYRLL